jgi:hypothetical protein
MCEYFTVLSAEVEAWRISQRIMGPGYSSQEEVGSGWSIEVLKTK